MRILNIALAALTLMVIGAVVIWDTDRRSSPGPLHPAHAAVKELQGSTGCDRCHGNDTHADLAAACNACHADIGRQVAEHKGLHGTTRGVERCGKCHVEHHGKEVAMVDDRVFSLAGVKDRKAFDHAQIAEFALSGTHTTLDCQKCHRQAEIAVLPADSSRYLGLSQKCSTCHRDPHEGKLGEECASCHGQSKAFDHVGEFHHKRFPIDGAHAELACVKCHDKSGAHSIEVLRDSDPEPRRCAACHGDPHGRDQKAMPLAQANDCAVCHSTTKFRGATFDVTAHARIGVDLSGAHARTACASCHTETRAESVARNGAIDAPMKRCTDCHAQEHAQGGKALPLAQANDCARCHGTERFKGTTFGVEEHRARGVDLIGAHQQADCARCHTETRARRPAAVDASGVAMTRCTDCHASPHGSALVDAVAHLQNLVGDASCVLCHDAESARFRLPDARIEADVHAATGMALTAPHDKLACEQCHAAGETAFASRFPGRKAEACEACHKDPHGGQFDAAGVKATCLSCHAATSFHPSRVDVDSHAQHGFELAGAHRAVACEKCHTQKAPAPRVFKGTARGCEACHVDPHDGRFDKSGLPREVEGRSGCARCHQEMDFVDVRGSFDHAKWTGFALFGSHAKASCVACHGRSDTPDTEGRTLGRAAKDCAQCHSDVHAGQFAAGTPPRTDCARCHDDSKDFHSLHFDHTRDTRFPLDATHAPLACTSCHRADTTRDGKQVVRYRPLAHQCTDCHGGREVRK